MCLLLDLCPCCPSWRDSTSVSADLDVQYDVSGSKSLVWATSHGVIQLCTAAEAVRHHAPHSWGPQKVGCIMQHHTAAHCYSNCEAPCITYTGPSNSFVEGCMSDVLALMRCCQLAGRVTQQLVSDALQSERNRPYLAILRSLSKIDRRMLKIMTYDTKLNQARPEGDRLSSQLQSCLLCEKIRALSAQ